MNTRLPPEEVRPGDPTLAEAAHDLREPLRALGTWLDLLHDQLGAEAAPEALRYLAEARACAERGRGLVDELLDLARAESGAAPLEDVPLEGALAEALGNLAAALHESGAGVDVGPLPVVRARRADVVRVLQNVVANALNARRGAAPQVRITAEVVDGHGELFVEDDGVGLGVHESERVFEPFQRLRSERRGTGLGLTLCRRLVVSHGGRIDLFPREDGGAVCRVRWRLADERTDAREG